MSKRIVVLGNGAWGAALAQIASRAGHSVSMWSRQAPDQSALDGADAVVVAVPAQAVRLVLSAVAVPQNAAMLIAAKGIEKGTGQFMHQVAGDVAPNNPVLILSGPSFAADVVASKPTAVTLAGQNHADANRWAEALSLPTFRIYGSDDIVGVALGGAMKNVLAIACGISDGRKLGDSARAALVTRSFAELMRFGRALGARSETLLGLSGLGDLMLTCSSPQSRNYAAGYRIGQGIAVAEVLAASSGTVEGAYTAGVAVALAQRHNIDMPIIAAVHAILDLGSDPATEITRLLARPLKPET